MKADEVKACVRSALAFLPDEVRSKIGGVDVLILEVAPKGCGEFDRAWFEGYQGVDEEEADDAGEDPQLPQGTITLVASRMRGALDVQAVLLHEVGHALGFDETDVSLMGLSDKGVEGDAASSTAELE